MEFQGSSRVVSMRRQTLRQSFETLQMQNNETVKEYLPRVVTIVKSDQGHWS